MALSERAGKPADPSILVDVDALLAAYHDRRPDPSDPAQRVAFGTSGHRGSAFRNAFNEAHILATTEAICRYRVQRGYGGPLFIGRDTHALSEPATATALSVLVARGRHLADGIVVTPSHNPPDDGGFKYNPPNGGPADTDVTGWIQDEANRILEGSGADGVDGVPRATDAEVRDGVTRYDFLGRYVDDLASREGARNFDG